MENNQSIKAPSIYTSGFKYGLVGGLLYCVLLFIRYNFFAQSPLQFGLFTICSYLVILVVYFMAGWARKKELGGFSSFKEIFQTIFLTIVITEIFFVLFNYVYLTYVDPGFFDTFKQSTLNFMERAGLKSAQIDEQMEKFKDMDKQLSPINILKGLGMWIVIDSIIGLIYAAILKKEKPVFDQKF